MICDDCTYDFPNAKRIIVIGDVHGDIKRFKSILIHANIINNDMEWIAQPDTIVVQMGDQVDSLNRNTTEDWEVLDDISMIHFTNTIDNIAKSKGGRLLSLIGNHELMNTMGNFSYVSDNSKTVNRTASFMPKGSLSHILGNRNLVLKIGKLFFCHAGIRKEHLDLLEKHNRSISCLNDIWKNYIVKNNIFKDDMEIFATLINGQDGILWTRNLENEENIKYILQKLDCSYIFIGHTTVPNVALYNKSIWLTDTGISRAYGNQQFQYIDILNNHITVKTIDVNK
jgi:hypothetical protein